ncbi:MAG: hypothetical protein GY807_00100 [Gammaproteobacteria bacterium]|nr:hypothetical protein [Gammaproteobacteria bacterium]
MITSIMAHSTPIQEEGEDHLIDLRDYIKEAEAMLTRVDIKKLPSYKLGMEKGMQRGAYIEKRRVAKSLIELLSEEVIAEKTGPPIGAVRKLREEKD